MSQLIGSGGFLPGQPRTGLRAGLSFIFYFQMLHGAPYQSFHLNPSDRRRFDWAGISPPGHFPAGLNTNTSQETEDGYLSLLPVWVWYSSGCSIHHLFPQMFCHLTFLTWRARDVVKHYKTIRSTIHHSAGGIQLPQDQQTRSESCHREARNATDPIKCSMINPTAQRFCNCDNVNTSSRVWYYIYI